MTKINVELGTLSIYCDGVLFGYVVPNGDSNYRVWDYRDGSGCDGTGYVGVMNAKEAVNYFEGYEKDQGE